MRIVYPPFVNHEGTFASAEADLEGNVSLNMIVKGKNGAIVLTAKEAAAIHKELTKLDVQSLAKIYA